MDCALHSCVDGGSVNLVQTPFPRAALSHLSCVTVHRDLHCCLFQGFQSRTEPPQVSSAVCGMSPDSLPLDPVLPAGCSPPLEGQVGLVH